MKVKRKKHWKKKKTDENESSIMIQFLFYFNSAKIANLTEVVLKP